MTELCSQPIRMEITTEPVFIRDVDINVRGNIILQLCDRINSKWPGEAIGAQKVHQVWRIYVKSPRTRAGLIVNGLNVNGVNVSVHDEIPVNDNNKLSERVVIKDLPATLPSDRILSFFRGLHHIRLKSKVIYAKERIGGEAMSQYINGDRIIYIAPNPTPPLPKETVIEGHPCRIWHKSQKNYCKRCDTHGHRTSDVGLCESYDADAPVTPFRADSNPLSNFFKCRIDFQGQTFNSSEHIYQYTKCSFLNRSDLADRIISSDSPREAKTLACILNCDRGMANWDKIKIDAMSKILRAKWNCSGRFRQTLMSTARLTIAEATQDTYWGVGVASNLAQYTNPSKFLGQNKLGKCLMSLRDTIEDTNPQSIDDVSFNLSPLAPRKDPAKSVDTMDSSDATSDSDTKTVPVQPQPTDHPTSDILEVPPTSIDTSTAGSTSNDTLVTPSPPSDNADMNLRRDSVSLDELPPPDPSDNVLTTQKSADPTTSTSSSTSATNAGAENIDHMDCEAISTASISATDKQSTGTTPTATPRRNRSLKHHLRRDLSQGSLDSFFVTRDSSLKRKPSGDVIISPTSDHVTKMTRSDGGDTKS